jgi:H+-translocating NAD(P) transhydrogenase subunit beta
MAVNIIVAVLIVIGFLSGIRLMQSPRTALWGNRLGALSMAIAVTWTFVSTGRGDLSSALIYIVIGSVIGLALGQAVRMIHMPQTVALLNGLGGAASALVVWAAFSAYGESGSAALFWGTSGLAIGVGALTFSGSLIAVMKLQGLAFRKPIQVPGHGHILRIMILLAILLVILNTVFNGLYSGSLMPIIILLGLLAGFFMALRIGGADMPIVISLLNSFSGIAAAIAGLAVENLILAGTGALVGVAGLILTRIMCRAMNRSLMAVLAGFTPGAHRKIPLPGEDIVDKETETGPVPGAEMQDESEAEEELALSGGEEAGADDGPVPVSESDLPELLKNALRVIIVPGYGMAVAQAQLAVRELVDALEAEGKEVKFAIHPVAGRMPGHMNVLLAEAGIDYEKLMDLDTINPQFEHADLAIIIGACDVVNPAANSAEGTPISGMPVLDAEKAKNVIVCNLDEKPGYSGVENILYEQAHVISIWGDASITIPKLTAMVKDNR